MDVPSSRPKKSDSTAVNTANARVPFSAWELPERSAAWCLREAGIRAEDLDAVVYSFDPGLCQPLPELGDALLHIDLAGLARRISPDAPVPVLSELREFPRPGGAALAAGLAVLR